MNRGLQSYHSCSAQAYICKLTSRSTIFIVCPLLPLSLCSRCCTRNINIARHHDKSSVSASNSDLCGRRPGRDQGPTSVAWRGGLGGQWRLLTSWAETPTRPELKPHSWVELVRSGCSPRCLWPVAGIEDNLTRCTEMMARPPQQPILQWAQQSPRAGRGSLEMKNNQLPYTDTIEILKKLLYS